MCDDVSLVFRSLPPFLLSSVVVLSLLLFTVPEHWGTVSDGTCKKGVEFPHVDKIRASEKVML